MGGIIIPLVICYTFPSQSPTSSAEASDPQVCEGHSLPASLRYSEVWLPLSFLSSLSMLSDPRPHHLGFLCVFSKASLSTKCRLSMGLASTSSQTSWLVPSFSPTLWATAEKWFLCFHLGLLINYFISDTEHLNSPCIKECRRKTPHFSFCTTNTIPRLISKCMLHPRELLFIFPGNSLYLEWIAWSSGKAPCRLTLCYFWHGGRDK